MFSVFSFLAFSNQIFASDTDGTIDPTFRYGWGENVGWVDFGSTAGDVHITDGVLSGSAYGENIGWIDLSTITNNNEGVLSGHAWGENIGWVDFSHATIGTDGVFAGGAYGENIGWITFGTSNNKVATDWRPASSRSSGHTSGGYRRPVAPITNIPLNTVCYTGDSFSATTGLPCASFQTPPPIANPTILPSTSLNLNRTLRLKIIGEDVKALQIYLNTHGYILTTVGLGSPSRETTKFGLFTYYAVIKFQKANNLTPDGIVGPITRSKLNIIK